MLFLTFLIHTSHWISYLHQKTIQKISKRLMHNQLSTAWTFMLFIIDHYFYFYQYDSKVCIVIFVVICTCSFIDETVFLDDLSVTAWLDTKGLVVMDDPDWHNDTWQVFDVDNGFNKCKIYPMKFWIKCRFNDPVSKRV